jgi:hypothetical protein
LVLAEKKSEIQPWERWHMREKQRQAEGSSDLDDDGTGEAYFSLPYGPSSMAEAQRCRGRSGQSRGASSLRR